MEKYCVGHYEEPKLYKKLEEIAEHNQAGDLWLLINNRVYDVSKFDHPGNIPYLLIYSQAEQKFWSRTLVWMLLLSLKIFITQRKLMSIWLSYILEIFTILMLKERAGKSMLGGSKKKRRINFHLAKKLFFQVSLFQQFLSSILTSQIINQKELSLEF